MIYQYLIFNFKTEDKKCLVKTLYIFMLYHMLYMTLAYYKKFFHIGFMTYYYNIIFKH